MDSFDFVEPKPKRRLNFAAAFWNLLTLLVLLGVVVVVGFFAMIYINPYSALNPFPPPTPVVVQPLPTDVPTATLTSVPTATPTMIVPTDEATQEATSTSTPLATPTDFVLSTATPTETATQVPYGLQSGSPKYIDSTIFHPELGCNFLGIGGQAFGADGAPVLALRVEVTGTLDGESVYLLSLTGAATQYGSGGYEIYLSDEPVDSTGSLQIVLLDQEGQPLSEPIFFDTYADCEQNLVLLNFSQVE